MRSISSFSLPQFQCCCQFLPSGGKDQLFFPFFPQEEMSKFQGAGQLFTTPALGGANATQASGQTYTYGPNGELVPK